MPGEEEGGAKNEMIRNKQILSETRVLRRHLSEAESYNDCAMPFGWKTRL